MNINISDRAYPDSTGLSSTTTTNVGNPHKFNQNGITLQGFRCPDCPDDTTSCVGCFRFEKNFETNIRINPVQKTFPFGTPIQPSCYNCPNHPINGGSGNCNCTLGTIPVIC